MSERDLILARHARGEISAPIALAQLLLGGEAPAPGTLPAPLEALATAHRAQLEPLAALARAGFEVTGEDRLAGTAALFDRLAGEAPEAAVAFYALGDPALLDAATAELVDVIDGWAPVADRDCLDFGCGIGRVASALARRGARVTGVDLSGGMIAEARRRTSGIPGLRLQHVTGGALPFADASFDRVILADVLPFLIQAGEAIATAALADFARLLRPGGALLVFNWSYRGDPARDRAEAEALARDHHLDLVRVGERPFTIWDGTGTHLRRRA